MPDDKLNSLNQTLMGIEGNLMQRKIERQNATIDGALDIINDVAAAGLIKMNGCCDDEDGDGDDAMGVDDGADDADDVEGGDSE